MFPQGGPGAALLLLRVAVALTLVASTVHHSDSYFLIFVGGLLVLAGVFPQSSLGALRGVGAIVAGVAAAGADCGVTRCPHGVGSEAWRSIDVAVAALDTRHGNVWRRGVASRGGAVVAA